jgi:hypothetical protein
MGFENISNLRLNEALNIYKTLYGEEFNFPNYSKSFLEYVNNIIDDNNYLSILKESIIIKWIGTRIFNFKYYTDCTEKYCYISSPIEDRNITRESHFKDLDYTIDKVLLQIRIFEAASQINIERKLIE